MKWGWTDDNVTKQCSVDWCDVEFGILKRKSHCRRCGQIFCKDHVKSGYKLGLSGESFDENGYECKLCDDCVDILENCNTGSIVRHE